MSKRPPNPRLVKINRDYTAPEIAERLGVHKNTVHNWIKRGLSTIDDRKPMMVRGIVLRSFLTEKREANKQPCPLGHLYCFRCRVPKKPDPLLTDYVPDRDTSGNLRGICPSCGTLMYRRIGIKQLTEQWPYLAVALSEAQ